MSKVIEETRSRVIPAIDIIEGKCVRLEKGDYATAKVYGDNPLDVAMSYKDSGIEYLHIVDLDGAKAQEPKNLKIVEKIRSKTKLKIDFGGGIKTRQSLIDSFNAGVEQVVIGSLAVKDQDLVKSWIDELGGGRIIIGADTIDGKIATDGWQETVKMDIFAFINDYVAAGGKYFLCTDIQKDGMLGGPSNALYKKILTNCEGINLLASGGVSSMDDVVKLSEMGVEGVIVGKALYEEKINIDDLSLFGNPSLNDEELD